MHRLLFTLCIALAATPPAVAADTPEEGAEAPEAAADTVLSVEGKYLNYKKEPRHIYPSENKTSAEINCTTTVTWNADGTLRHAYTPMGEECPLSFARASSSGFTSSILHPMTPPTAVQSTVKVKMVLEGGDASSVVEDIFHVTQPLELPVEHCVLVVGIARQGGVHDLASNDRTRCLFEPSKGVNVPRKVWKELPSEVVCELTATAVDWKLGEPTFTECPASVRAEASRLVSEWAVVQSPPPRNKYEITLLFQGPT